MKSETALKIKRLRWQCRRGMLEVDLYLMAFIDYAFASSSDYDQRLFESLLKENDPVLLAWLTGKETPQDRGMASIVSAVRSTRVQVSAE